MVNINEEEDEEWLPTNIDEGASYQVLRKESNTNYGLL